MAGCSVIYLWVIEIRTDWTAVISKTISAEMYEYHNHELVLTVVSVYNRNVYLTIFMMQGISNFLHQEYIIFLICICMSHQSFKLSLK